MVTVSFNPPSVTAGESSTATFTVAARTERIVAPVTITGTGASGARVASLTVEVKSLPGCSGTNNTPKPISEFGEPAIVESKIMIRCDTTPSKTSTVEVHIQHNWINDLVVQVVSPQGHIYTLLDHPIVGVPDTPINQTFTVDMSNFGEFPYGVWTLRVNDTEPGNIGIVHGWTLSM